MRLSHANAVGLGLLRLSAPHRQHDIQPILDDNSGCVEGGDQPTLKKSHSYYAQIQTQMLVCDVMFGDFVLWTHKTLFICRIARDEDFISQIKTQLPVFWHQHYLPELLTRKLELGDSAITSDENVPYPYCICKKERGGEMIGCDNPSCRLNGTTWRA